MRGRPSDYERRAYDQIQKWKKPERGWFGQKMQSIRWPFETLRTRIKNFAEQRKLNEVIQKALVGCMGLLGDAAAWSVRPEAVYSEFRRAAHNVDHHTDVFELDLQQVDAVVGWLDAKYKGLALAEGTATGATGVPGLIVDIPALITLNLRAIAEYATYYGLDIASQRERLFALNVLCLASSSTDVAKTRVMAQLARIGKDIAKNKTWKDLEKAALVKMIQQVAKALRIRLTKAKLAQAVPIMGAAVGGGFNAFYAAQVCDTAYHLYRERFLVEKYGPDMIDITANPG